MRESLLLCFPLELLKISQFTLNLLMKLFVLKVKCITIISKKMYQWLGKKIVWYFRCIWDVSLGAIKYSILFLIPQWILFIIWRVKPTKIQNTLKYGCYLHFLFYTLATHFHKIEIFNTSPHWDFFMNFTIFTPDSLMDFIYFRHM